MLLYTVAALLLFPEHPLLASVPSRMFFKYSVVTPLKEANFISSI